MLRVMTYAHLIFINDQASNDEATQVTTTRTYKTKNRIDQCQTGNSIEPTARSQSHALSRLEATEKALRTKLRLSFQGGYMNKVFKSRLNLIVRVNDISVMKGVLIKGRKKTDFEFKLSFSSLNKQYAFFIYKTAKCVILPFILPRKTCLCLGAS